ncbi:MAG: crossover junction endodeoxyribonuclease RuvC [Syntrophorhabdaceae bacterium]|nr:crossover junction endodeoxyribonuclease RuvC [Syntrophorhabdaceae bacterium]
MVIFGIDPGLANTGFGAIHWNSDRPVLIKCGHIKTTPKLHVSERLLQINKDMVTLIDTIKPEIIAVENVFSLVRYPVAGILLGCVIGIIYLLASECKLKLIEVGPKEVKNSLVGYGSANKRQVREAVQKLLNMSQAPSFHASDALAIAITAYYRYRHKSRGLCDIVS